MIVRIVAFLLFIASIQPLLADEENPQSPTPRPGILHRMLNVFHKGKPAGKALDPKEKNKSLVLSLSFAPQPVKLSEGNKIQVMLQLTNGTGKFVQLDFPTTQRIEVLLRNQAGKIVSQWSEEQAFSNDAGYITLDPGEHVEYTVTLSGRDLVAGKTYIIEGFFPNYENLRVSKEFVPVR
jgi:hypothetical protein